MPNLVGIGNSQVPTNAMLGGLAYKDSVGEINLDKINAKTSDAAVEVFVYDTRKDSDGGAWRHRTQNTSWYNESIGEMRGARREFPAVAVIVAITNKIIIYDGDDPNLSMWMVLKKGPSLSMLYSTSSAIFNTVSAFNGNVYYGMNGNGGLGKIEFINDSSFKYRPGNRSNRGRFKGRIVDRDSTLGWITESNTLVDEEVFSIAHTVLSDAPIDEYTGLQRPTIAVATDGGVSVIKSDGTISNLTPGGGVEMNSVSFDENNNLIMGRNNFILYRSDHPHYLSNQVDNGYTVNNRGNSAPSVGEDSSGSTSLTDVVATSDSSIAFDTQTLGLGLYDVNAENNSNSMVAYITTNYNTGYMIGDIKCDLLSDTDATDVTGSESVTNPGPFTSTTGWAAANAGWSVSDSNNRLVINSGSQTGSYFGASQTLTLVDGKKYVLVVNIHSQTKTAVIRLTADGNYFTSTGLGTGEHSFYFTANQATHSIFIGSDTGGTNREQQINYVNIREVEEDRSVNNKGLQVFGTIQKDPVATGAELVAYHGVSATNYLRQPYNSDLNFGTGDFSVIVWVKKNNFTTNHYIIDRATTAPSWGGSSGRSYFIINSNGYHRYKLAGGSEQTGNQVQVPTGVFAQVAFVRRSGVMEFYLNGQLVQTITGGNASASFDSGVTTQTMTVNRYANGFAYDYTFDRMALLRISGDAPSAKQMKKIYDDEKGLFHENAKCTLYGTSNDVKALAFDNTNDILHAGTSSGRSEFQGLNRINNTTTAVTTSISASNGLVAEQ
tara:strand:- start:620 stop:2950 length:2331 start_codon:yes stop_codon:yes gene_type:complete